LNYKSSGNKSKLLVKTGVLYSGTAGVLCSE
jgi:hypothetical protein